MTSHLPGESTPKGWPNAETMGPPNTHPIDLYKSVPRALQQRPSNPPYKNSVEPSSKRQRLNADGEFSGRSPSSAGPDTPRDFDLPRTNSPSILSPTQNVGARVHRRSLFPGRPQVATADWSRRQENGTFAIERAKMKESVPTRPYVAEPPACAPRYQGNSMFQKNTPLTKKKSCSPPSSESSDFFPWTGRHPEDGLSEMSIRSGFYDKGFPSECLSIRGSVLSGLRTKTGPKLLSALLVSALDRRQEHGEIVASSTFKPPPRVTLTDTKREAWLKDLANPAIPLRRLSRTIPHGIRGKMLLDHCLSKEVPLGRAVWLIKCVGANEIRAFKRKGAGGVFTAGGESKWVQDWSLNVEQFMEGLFVNCGSSDWRQKMNYGLRLVSHIFAEHLVDRTQFLTWVLMHLEKSDLDHLPIWLLQLNVYKRFLLRSRRLGKRLAAALLAHLEGTLDPDKRTAYLSLTHDLVREIRNLMASQPACFLMPRQWPKYERLIRDETCADSEAFVKRFESIRDQNDALRDPTLLPIDNSHYSWESGVTKLLDSTSVHHNYAEIAATCLDKCKDHDALVNLCVRWAVSSYRYGVYRIYAATRYLRMWREQGLDLQEPICEMLASSHDMSDTNEVDLFDLITELIHTSDFSVGQYCQWLLARGAALSSESNLRPEARLLPELPLSGLPSPVRNLRQSLLRSLGQSMQASLTCLDTYKAWLDTAFPELFTLGPGSIEELQTKNKEPPVQSVAVKHEIAAWILVSIERHAESHKMKSVAEDLGTTSFDILDARQFEHLRSILERLGAYPVLGDIMELCCRSHNSALLAAVTETVNYHLDCFTALEYATPLFDLLYGQLIALPVLKDADRSFPQALTDLAARMPNRRNQLRKLRREFFVDLKATAAAPSPISDNMIDAVDSSNPTFADEMEQLLANGASIDEATFSRVFATISGHVRRSWLETHTTEDRISELLGRLRPFNHETFDVLMSEWLSNLIRLKDRPRMSTIVQPLVCNRVVTLSAFLHAMTDLLDRVDQDETTAIAIGSFETLASMSSEVMPVEGFRSYRFLQQLEACVQKSSTLITKILAICIGVTHPSKLPSSLLVVQEFFETPPSRSLWRMTLSAAATTAKANATSAQVHLGEIFRACVTGYHDLDVCGRARYLVDTVSYFNLEIYGFELLNLLQSTEDAKEVLTTAMSIAVTERTTAGPRAQDGSLCKFLSTLPLSAGRQVRDRLEERLLSAMTKDTDSSNTQPGQRMQTLVDVLTTSGFGLPSANLDMVRQYAEALGHLVASLLRVMSNEDGDPSDQKQRLAQIDDALRILTVHQSTVQQAEISQDDLSQICLLIAQLHTVLAQQRQQQSLSAHLLDVLMILTDPLTDASRTACHHALTHGGDRVNHNISFIFADLDRDECQWLRLIHGGISASSETGSKTTATDEATNAPKASSTSSSPTPEPFHLRRWEMVQDATPSVGENDTSLSLTLFGARKAVL